MDEKIRTSLDEIIDYLYSEERQNWEEAGKPDDHIYLHLDRVMIWLGYADLTDDPQSAKQ